MYITISADRGYIWVVETAKALFSLKTKTSCYMKIKSFTVPRLTRIRSIFLLCCFSFLFQTTGFSQATTTITVSGKVLLGAGSPDLSGTTVQVKGSKKGATTDATGHFSIAVPGNASLVFTHIGYKTVEVRVNNQPDISITLETADNTLEQV